MDDQQKQDQPQDMTVGKDGSMTETSQADTQSVETTTPVVNDVTPPPAPEVEPSSGDTIKVNVVSAAAEESHEEEVVAAPEQSVESADQVAPAPSPAEEVEKPEVKDDSADEHTSTTENETSTEAAMASDAAPVSPAQDSKDPSAAPAVVGVAASQMGGKHPHRNNKKLAVIVTIVTAVLLAGIAVYVYMSANSNTSQESTSSKPAETTTTTQQQTTPATANDVDTTTNDVDQAINALDETADFAEEDLSDTSLGL